MGSVVLAVVQVVAILLFRPEQGLSLALYEMKSTCFETQPRHDFYLGWRTEPVSLFPRNSRNLENESAALCDVCAAGLSGSFIPLPLYERCEIIDMPPQWHAEVY